MQLNLSSNLWCYRMPTRSGAACIWFYSNGICVHKMDIYALGFDGQSAGQQFWFGTAVAAIVRRGGGE
jgi:hypothetical protein